MVYYTFVFGSTFIIKIICTHVISEFDCVDVLLLYCYYQNDV